MSDTEEVEVPEVEVSEAPAVAGGITLEDAIQGVLKQALIKDGLARGLREASKALTSGQAQLTILCDSVTEDSYVRLIEALCNEPDEKVPLIKISDAKKLGEWAGLCKLDAEGNARKVVGCGVVVVQDWGVESQEREVLLNYLNSQ